MSTDTSRRRKAVDISIVIPAYNESKCIAETLAAVRSYVGGQLSRRVVEIVVVTADSTDTTVEQVAKIAANEPFILHVRPGPRAGKGRDVRLGILAARGRSIIFTDADLATPLSHISEAVEMLELGADVVAGERMLLQIHTGYRRLVSVAASAAGRSLTGFGIRDTQCGFKGFTREAAREIFSRTNVDGWGFDIEVLTIARIKKMKVATLEIPDWAEHKAPKDQLAGQTNTVAAIRTAVEVIRIYWLLLTGRYR